MTIDRLKEIIDNGISYKLYFKDDFTAEIGRKSWVGWDRQMNDFLVDGINTDWIMLEYDNINNGVFRYSPFMDYSVYSILIEWLKDPEETTKDYNIINIKRK